MANDTSTFGSFLDGAAGSAQGKEGQTVTTFVLSLAAGFVLFGVQAGLFLVFRNYLWAKRIYQPRSFLIPLKDRVQPPPSNVFKWIWTVFKIEENPEVLKKAGMDAYFFLRYLSMCLKIFFPLLVLILPILLPLNFNKGKGTRTIGNTIYNIRGLDTVAWSNVSPERTSRYWAHLVLAVVVVAWTCYNFHQELMHYVVTRQAYLGSTSHRLKASSTTVLIADIPHDICSPEALTELYDDFPGGIRRIWINRDFQPLVDKDRERKRFEDLLENAETNMIRQVVKRDAKMRKKSSGPSSTLTQNETQLDELRTNGRTNSLRNGAEHSPHESRPTDVPATIAACQRDLQHDIATKAVWTRYLKQNQRPTMRISTGSMMCKIPLVGRWFCPKIDTIYYCRRELAFRNKEIETGIDDADSYPQNGSAFIQFNTQKAAHLACQSVADIMPRKMTKRTVEISPGDINWANLNSTWKTRYVRLIWFLFLFGCLVFGFGIISFFTGILSRASTLGNSTSWLAWITKLPPWLVSFIQGTLPPVILVILLSGPLPIILRHMTNTTRGATTGSQGERSLQLWYFIILLLELFLIPTVSSGLTSIVRELLHSPGSVPNILATNLPTAANYYFSFLIVQALSISASSILQTIRLFNFYLLGGVNTPDSVYNKLSWTNRTRIGSNIPWYTTFAVIGLVYSVIAPLILIFMIITFSLFWVVIKNNLLYVVRTGNVDGGGLFFPSAINQMFTGLYFMEICLVGLFFLVRDANDKVACEAQGVVMVAVLILTVFYQIWLNVNFQSLYRYAPVRLGTEAAKRDREAELEHLISADQTTESPAPMVNDSKEYLTPMEEKPRADLASNEDVPMRLRPRTDTTTTFNPDSKDRSRSMQARQDAERQSAKHLLARLNRPLDETRLAQLEDQLRAAEQRVGNVLIPKQRDVEARMMNDPISRIIMQHNDELENLSADERDMLLSIAFTHPVLRETRPAVWIPRDDLGVSDDEVSRTQIFSSDVTIDNRGAYFDRKLKVRVDKPPPDMSEFALVMAEL